MKKLIPVFALLMLCFYSCKKEPKKTIPKSKVVAPTEKTIPKIQNSNASTGVIGGAHYICPKNCIGGNSSATGNCSVCSSVLAHNQGFHNTPSNNNIITPSATTPTPTSGQNAVGQYHYTCANGCAGGGDSAGKCVSCNGNLAHNAAFHN
jgi:hypothetical protein